MQFETGARLGPYEIVALLGAGGMGEVYRGRDTRLGRSVAIKVISGDLKADADRRIRFQREAKAILSLNHPHICALYDVGEDGGRQYIVMEYLEGETLQDRLQNGPLPLDQAVRYGIEIADALDSAHRKQILHRDLKPSNIMITANGARLFDFGLAKVLRGESQTELLALSAGSTAAKPITVDGAVVGTPEYLAPEQLQGREPDVRTDIFAFGLCLYQMITGHRAFRGNTYASLVAAILAQDPDPVSDYRADVPSALEWLIRNCLAKDPNERLQTAHDVKLELTRIADEMHDRPAAHRAGRFAARRWVYGSVAATVLITIAGTILVREATKPVAKSSIRRYSIALPTPLPEIPFELLAVSPDGARIAYIGGGETTRLYLHSVDTQETKALPGTDGARGPFFSPDGQWIGFYATDQGLKKVSVAGGEPILVSSERDLRGAAWRADDTIVFAQVAPPMRRVSASGGPSEPLSLGTPGEMPASVRWPGFLPGGDSILFTAADVSGDYEHAKLMVASLKTGKTKTVLSGATYGRYANGHLLYLHSQTLFAAPFDVRAMAVTGAAVPLASDVDYYFSSGLTHFAVASDGSVFYIPRDPAAAERQLLWVTRGGESTPIGTVRREYGQPKISPDGKRILATVGPVSRADLWSYDVDRDTWSRLTTEGRNTSGVWSPDGTQIAFASTRNGGNDLYIMASDAGTPAKRITARRAWDFPTSWSSNGRIAVVEQYRSTFNDIYVVAPQPNAVPVPFLNTQSDEQDPAFSPDGHWIAYRSNESGRDEIYVQSFPQPGQRRQLSTNGGEHPVWRRDGAELFYRSGAKMIAVPVRLKPEFASEKPQTLFEGDFDDEYDVSADGQKFVMVKRPPHSPRTQINVILGQ